MKLLATISLLVLLLGCRTTKESSSEETKRTERLVEQDVKSPGESVSTAINCDSVLALLNTQKQAGKPDTVLIPSRNGLAELKFYIDQFGRLTAECDSKDRIVQALVKELEIERNKVKEVIKEVPVEVPVEVLPTWVIPVIMVMAFFIFLLIIILRYGKK